MDDIRVSLDQDTPTSLARRVAQRALHRWGMSDHSDDVLIVISELVQNVTQHTDDGGELRLLSAMTPS